MIRNLFELTTLSVPAFRKSLDSHDIETCPTKGSDAGFKLVAQLDKDVADLASMSLRNPPGSQTTHPHLVYLSFGPLIDPEKHMFGMQQQLCDVRIQRSNLIIQRPTPQASYAYLH